MVPASLPSSSILLIEPAPALSEIILRYFPSVLVEVCPSFENAVSFIPLHCYQVVICPQRLASRDQYALLRLNQRHHSWSPFIVTTEREEIAHVQRAIDAGALGFLHGATTTPTIIHSIERLLRLYRLRVSLARRAKWATDFRERLRTNPIQETWETLHVAKQDNRVMCQQTLTAIEGSMQAFRGQANDFAAEARQRMWEI
ncbi:MAG: hypothetical protein OJF51_000685 [Nitrospira sp.]|nr:MAG: hypothetical protein OJF51_000685 [Nitrospira sp.]